MEALKSSEQSNGGQRKRRSGNCLSYDLLPLEKHSLSPIQCGRSGSEREACGTARSGPVVSIDGTVVKTRDWSTN